MTYFLPPFLPSRSSHIPCLARFQIHDLSFTQSVAVCTYASVYIAISLKLRGLCNTIRMRVFRAEHLVLDDELMVCSSPRKTLPPTLSVPQLPAVPLRGLRLCGLLSILFGRPTGDVLMQLMIG